MRKSAIAIVVGCWLVGGVAFAQTPDGETPAREGVCDVLRENGVTKGLYGLCIAFCEAQDWEMCAGDLEECGKSASRILENYGRKKAETDPDMPCIVAADTCPCWDGGPDAPFPEVGLEALWATRAPSDCDVVDSCFNNAPLRVTATCHSGSDERLTTTAGNSRGMGLCAASDQSSVPQIPISVEAALVCQEELLAFIGDGGSTGCGLPSP